MPQVKSSEEKLISELEIRSNILSHLGSKTGEKYRIVEEFGIGLGESRIDIAVVNGRLDGYEIKSDYDSLKRLPGQIERYSSVVDQLTLVTTTKHFKNLRKLSPSWCGLIIVSKVNGKLEMQQVRKPKRNRKTRALALVHLLWREELLALVAKGGLTKGLSKYGKHDLYSKILETLDEKVIKKAVLSSLFNRSSWRVDSQHA